VRPRTVNIVVSVSGMTMPLATVTIQNFTKFLEPETELVCPACHSKPVWAGKYTCSCGKEYTHWSQLKRVVKGTGQEIVKRARVTVKDETSARNLRKLLIATKNLGKVEYRCN